MEFGIRNSLYAEDEVPMWLRCRIGTSITALALPRIAQAAFAPPQRPASR